MEAPVQHQLALEELRRSFDQYGSSADSLDEKASSLLAGSNIFVGLFALLQLTLLKPGQGALYWTCIVLVLIGYLALIWTCTRVLQPREFKTTISADWDQISTQVLALDPQAAYEKLISAYIQQIPHNRAINENKAHYLGSAAWIFPVLIVLLLILSVMPR